MSYDDFCRCTPSFFYAVYSCWLEREERMERGCWERARFLGLCAVQPHSKDRLKAEDVIRFSWDAPDACDACDADGGGAVVLSEEARRARFEAAKKRYGMM